MGFFKKVLLQTAKKNSYSQAVMITLQNHIKTLQECANLVNNTVNPEVFFGRLNFMLDNLLYLLDYDSHPFLKKGEKPSVAYKRTLDNLELTVNDFIDRALDSKMAKIQSLKTGSGKVKALDKFCDLMLDSFKKSNSFYTGSWLQSGPLPHYNGPLYTQGNMNHLHDMIEAYKNSI